MHFKYTNQQEEIALKEFERTGSVCGVAIQKLGYPSPHQRLCIDGMNVKSWDKQLVWIFRSIRGQYRQKIFLQHSEPSSPSI